MSARPADITIPTVPQSRFDCNRSKWRTPSRSARLAMGFEIRIGPNMNVSGGEVGQAQALSLELAFNGLHDFLSRQCGDCYEFCLLTCRALAGGSNSEALGVWDRRKARRRCMFLTTAARRSASCFIASAISASRRSTRDAVLSFGSLFSGSGCFASP
jgi:hypothetical protein